jgi:hypothetical protein
MLDVAVPWLAPAGVYQLNITSTAPGGNTCTAPLILIVTTATINVSGTVTADFNQDIYPTQITFTSASTKQSYSTNVLTTPPAGTKSPSGVLVQTGRYSISLPNQDSYTVVCSWIRLGGPWTPQGPEASGTFSGGVVHVNCKEGSASMENVNF